MLIGLVVGDAIGAFHGYLIAYLQIPSFIVTLGGLLVWRGAALWMARGETIAPLDATFALLGGGPYGSIGATGAGSSAVIACVGDRLPAHDRRRAAPALRLPDAPGLGGST